MVIKSGGGQIDLKVVLHRDLLVGESVITDVRMQRQLDAHITISIDLRAFSPATEDSFQQSTVVDWQMTHPSRYCHWLDREASDDETGVCGKRRKLSHLEFGPTFHSCWARSRTEYRMVRP